MFGLWHLLSSTFAAIVLGSIEGSKYVKEKLEPKPPENALGNMELFQQDVLDGVSSEQRMQNMMNGKYVQKEVYPEPHRGADGKIIIDDYEAFNRDKERYGALEAYNRARRGAYNLSEEEIEKNRQKIEEKYKKLYKLIGAAEDEEW